MTKDEFFNYGKYGGTMNEVRKTMNDNENNDDEGRIF